MVSKATIAKPYAKAAFEVALKEQSLQPWLQMLQMAGIIVTDKAVIDILRHPNIKKAKKLAMIEDLLEGQLDGSRGNFIQILAESKRMDILPEIAERFFQLYQEYEKVIEVDLITVESVAPHLQEKLSKALEHKLQRKVKLKPQQDSSVIGGAVIRAGDLVIDGSVRGKLARLQNDLINNGSSQREL